jgi:hypothetical protein
MKIPRRKLQSKLLEVESRYAVLDQRNEVILEFYKGNVLDEFPVSHLDADVLTIDAHPSQGDQIENVNKVIVGTVN